MAIQAYDMHTKSASANRNTHYPHIPLNYFKATVTSQVSMLMLL